MGELRNFQNLKVLNSCKNERNPLMIQDIQPSRLQNHYEPDAAPQASDPVFCFDGDELAERDFSAFPTYADFDLPHLVNEKDFTFLFRIDGIPYFLLDITENFSRRASHPEEAAESMIHAALTDAGFSFSTIRELRKRGNLTPELIYAAFTALHLVHWYRSSLFCGRCGARTVKGPLERSMVCPRCGQTIYPRINPAVIVGVTNGDCLLQTRYVRSRHIPYYALVAGFTEIGETFEQTVEREVMEEAGLHVKNIRYFKSQPWGIADDILAGFYCDVDGDPTIHRDSSELSEAVWTRREDITGQPDDLSLTHHMMITFREGKEPK